MCGGVSAGEFVLTFKKPIWLKTHKENDGHNYIDVYAIGNAASTFAYGFENPIFIQSGWLRFYVDGRLTINNGYAYVDNITLYFVDFRNSGKMIDPVSAQVFIFCDEV